MMSTLRAAERKILEAATTGSREAAWQGFSTHPLVRTPELGAKLLGTTSPVTRRSQSCSARGDGAPQRTRAGMAHVSRTVDPALAFVRPNARERST
ncbi:hypothetical protein [Brachybacterium sp. AOP3-A1-3]|uniref:hypothetical protein n=1 Tax=Brachybacterium sp. AOP3-A1-3 TaxID=3457699 RepID=UPI004034DE83